MGSLKCVLVIITICVCCKFVPTESTDVIDKITGFVKSEAEYVHDKIKGAAHAVHERVHDILHPHKNQNSPALPHSPSGVDSSYPYHSSGGEVYSNAAGQVPYGLKQPTGDGSTYSNPAGQASYGPKYPTGEGLSYSNPTGQSSYGSKYPIEDGSSYSNPTGQGSYGANYPNYHTGHGSLSSNPTGQGSYGTKFPTREGFTYSNPTEQGSNGPKYPIQQESYIPAYSSSNDAGVKGRPNTNYAGGKDSSYAKSNSNFYNDMDMLNDQEDNSSSLIKNESVQSRALFAFMELGCVAGQRKDRAGRCRSSS